MTTHSRHARRPRIAGTPAPVSPIAEQFALQIRALELPRPIREYRPCTTRRWRLDFAYPDMHVAVEIDGEVHRIKARFHADIEKHAWLVLNGWTLLRVGGREVRAGTGVNWLQSLLWERAPLGLGKAHPGREARQPAPESENANCSQLASVPHGGTDLWISAANDATGLVEPSLGQRKWAITP